MPGYFDLFPRLPRCWASAYEPTYAWHPSRSRPARQMIVIIATLASCTMLATSLWRSRWNLLALAIISADLRRSVRLAIRTHGTVLTMTAGALGDVDHWTFQTSPASTRAEMKCLFPTWPVFASQAEADQSHCVMDCNSDGVPIRFRYDLPANARMAFVTRTAEPE